MRCAGTVASQHRTLTRAAAVTLCKAKVPYDILHYLE